MIYHVTHFCLTISRPWYLDLMNQTMGVKEPIHAVPIGLCHYVYSSMQCSHCRSVDPMPITITSTSSFAGLWVFNESQFTRVRLIWSWLQSGDTFTLTDHHVCACLFCFSLNIGLVSLLSGWYLVLVDIWSISSPEAFLKIARGNW